MKELKDYNEIMTHAGVMHADDVMCVALAKAVNPDIKVTRTNRIPEDLTDDVLVVDIGGGRYDHHASGENDDRAACGLLLDDHWQEIFPSEESYEMFNEDVIKPIEETDNGKNRNPLSMFVNSYNPAWDDDTPINDNFDKVTNIMSDFVTREADYAKSTEKAKSLVTEDLNKSDGKVVALSQFMPWQETLIPTSAVFVVFPSLRGGYNLQVVPKEIGDNAAKEDLPAEWLENKPEGCSFVHKNLFMAAFDTEEQAVDAAEDIVKKMEAEKHASRVSQAEGISDNVKQEEKEEEKEK